MIQIKINKGNRYMRRSPEETKYKVPGILSQRSYMDAPNFPAIVCDNM